ncbi:GL26153 [Drosophila persimilis]|uniref:Small ribosomal subunit protein eS28 n=2 Tax=pseudoobscura subgroup TaxID=32358 RepID=B5DH72_DROPS|nr:40S ribosomal protein S28 [Drosophila persimilis]XP_002132245.1 40S ribosomal protein S28 [Drosophila pseudoobscura]XP_017152825.1 40S ribosomal protein S28 [Drosophila miranda]EDW37245.1 GL26153 [Drosophila persimilis]
MESIPTKGRVIKILGRIGARGYQTEVRVQLLSYPRIQFLQKVKGPVHLGDVVNVEDSKLEHISWQS